MILDRNSEFLMPKSIAGLKTILTDFEKNVSIEFNDTNAKFTYESFTLSCRLIEENIQTTKLLYKRKSK